MIARGSEAFDVAGRLATSSGSLQQKPVQGELDPVLKMLGEGCEAI